MDLQSVLFNVTLHLSCPMLSFLLSYRVYYKALKAKSESNNLSLRRLIRHGIGLYQQSWKRGFFSEDSRLVDIKFVEILLKHARNEHYLIDALEAYFLGVGSQFEIVEKVLTLSEVPSRDIKRANSSLRHACKEVSCSHKKNVHCFRKGSSGDSELEEAVIAAIHVYEERRAYERYSQMSEDQRERMHKFLLALTEQDVLALDATAKLDSSERARCKEQMTATPGNNTAILSVMPTKFRERYRLNLDYVRTGRIPLSGRIHDLDFRYNDVDIVKNIIYNLCVKHRLKPGHRLWEWFEDNLDSEDSLQDFLDYLQESYPDYFKRAQAFAKAYRAQRRRVINLLELANVDQPEDILLCLHGWLDCADTWYPLAVHAEQAGMAVFAYDQFGFGRDYGRTLNRLDAGRMLLDLEFVIKHIKQEFPVARIHLVGHSMGGAIIGELAAFSEIRDDVHSFHAITPAVIDSVVNFVNFGKATGKIDREEVLLKLGQSPGILPTSGRRFGIAQSFIEMLYSATNTFKPLTELMLSAYDIYGHLMSEGYRDMFLYIGGCDVCVNLADFRRLKKEHPDYKVHGFTHRFFPHGFHMLAQGFGSDHVNERILADVKETVKAEL